MTLCAKLFSAGVLLLAAVAWPTDAALALGPHAVVTGGPSGAVTTQEATLTFAASSGGLVSRFECRLDRGGWSTCVPPKTYTGLVEGPHRFEVRLVGLLVDATPAVREWVVAPGTRTPPPPKRQDADGCAYGGNRVGEVSARRLKGAVSCVLSKVRGRRGLSPLRRNGALDAAAAAHGRDMVANNYASHTSRNGSTPADRIRRRGYFRGTSSWNVGEVLAFSPDRFTPSRVVRAWLRSPAHRSVILGRSYRQVGVGIIRGLPTNRRTGATWVGNVGRRG